MAQRKRGFNLSGGGFNATPIKTNFGGGSNQNQLLSYVLAQQQAQNSPQITNQIQSQFGGLAPVGSSLTGKGQANIELNRPLPENAETTLRLGRTQAANLSQNVNQLIGSKNIQSRLSPFNLSAHSNILGNLALQIEGLRNNPDTSEFTAFKSRTEQLFQQYRKYITGVQAGFPELQMLQPIFPVTTDPSSNYVSKALSALETMKTNEDTLIDYSKRRGYQFGNLEGSFPANTESIRQNALQVGINVGRGGRVRVKNKVTGQTGTISSSNFDPNKYERI